MTYFWAFPEKISISQRNFIYLPKFLMTFLMSHFSLVPVGGAKLHCQLRWGHGRIGPLDPPLPLDTGAHVDAYTNYTRNYTGTLNIYINYAESLSNGRF